MSEFKFASDAALKERLEKQRGINAALHSAAEAKKSEILSDVWAIKRIARAGYAEKVFSIGEEVVQNWTESVSGVTYAAPHNIVAIRDAELQCGEVKNGVWMQWKYATPFDMPFDAQEAFYYAEEGLSAGTYYFTVGTNSGALTKGEIYEFTLENDVPEGGQIVLNPNTVYRSSDGRPIYVYASVGGSETIEEPILTLVTESVGTDLGTLTNEISGNLNSIQRAVYGNNCWSQSVIRQWLNSSAGIGEWWEAQNNWDRAPSQLDTYPGFLAGYDEEFVETLQKVKVVTALSTYDGGGEDVTYDKIFLPSLEQMYITPLYSGVEGDYFPYWKEACGSEEPIARGTNGAMPITYSIGNKTAQDVRLRSANNNTYTAWNVTSTGYVGSYNASTNSYRIAPVGVIC